MCAWNVKKFSEHEITDAGKSRSQLTSLCNIDKESEDNWLINVIFSEVDQ